MSLNSPSAALRCLVVDDDPMAVQVVQNCIANTPFLVSVGSCTSAIEAADFLRTNPVDVLFLDVEMPLMSGLDLLGTLESSPAVVLITSNPSYAVKAFGYDVVDYLVKPITYARFLMAARRALAAVELQQNQGSSPDADAAYVKVDGKLVRVRFAEVLYVEALGDYVHIVTNSGQKLVVHGTLRSVEEKFPAQQFVRVHRSFIANLRHIQFIEDNAVVIGNKHIPIGQTYQRDVLQRLNKF